MRSKTFEEGVQFFLVILSDVFNVSSNTMARRERPYYVDNVRNSIIILRLKIEAGRFALKIGHRMKSEIEIKVSDNEVG